jgi:hypothetical protein
VARNAPGIADAWIAAIKRHALDHYNEDGWDFCVESMTDDEIREALERGRFEDGRVPTTEAEAIARIGEICTLLDERRRDIRGTAW